MALTDLTLGRSLSGLFLTLLISVPVGAHSFKVAANDTFTFNLDSGCISVGSPTGSLGSGGNEGPSGGGSRRLLQKGDVQSKWGGKHDHGVMNDAVVLAPQPSCPIYKAIATEEPGEFLLSPDGGKSCIGLSQYANPSRYLMPGDRNKLTELIPLQRVECNPGCRIPNMGCGIPFSFSDCSSKSLGCTGISVKGNLPYGNGGLMRTAEWATSLMAQPILIKDPYNTERVEFQVQPNNTQIYLGHPAPKDEPKTREQEKAQVRGDTKEERVDDVIVDRMWYTKFQKWSALCITCRGLGANSSAGLRTSAKWELVPGGTNPMGAPQQISVSHGVSDERSRSKTTSTTHTHSVALAISNAVMFGFQAFGFSFSDTLTTTTTTTNTVSHEVSEEIAQSVTRTVSSTFTQACPSSSEPYLKDNPGFQKGVAMWQWVVRGEYQTEMQCGQPWATYWSHHVVCTYGDLPRTYGPPPKCPPTYCKGGAAANCQTCSSYEWQNATTSPPPNQPFTTNPYLAAKTGNAGENSIAQDNAGAAPSSSAGSDHSAVIIGVVVGVVGVGLLAGVVFVVYRKHTRSQKQPHGYQEALMPEQAN